MAAQGLRESMDVAYINGCKGNPKSAQVHLFLRGDHYKLQVAKLADKKCRILDEIWIESIGALVVTQYKIEKYKKK